MVGCGFVGVVGSVVDVGSTLAGGESVVVTGNPVDVGGTLVGASVGGGLVDMATATVGVGDTAIDDSVNVGADVQATTKTTAKIGTMRGKY